MESSRNTGRNLSNLYKITLVVFAVALLVSTYILFSLPSDLRFKGNLQNLELVTPVLAKLYASLAITGALAIVSLYLEMKRVKVAIVYKDRTTIQTSEERSQADSANLGVLDSKLIARGTDNKVLTDSLNALSKRLNGVAGACYVCKEESGTRFAELVTGFALPLTESDAIRFNFGDGLVGQAAKSGAAIYVDEIPEGYYQAESGLGQARPKFILLLPVKKGSNVRGVFEIATFTNISSQEKQVAEKFALEIGELLS